MSKKRNTLGGASATVMPEPEPMEVDEADNNFSDEEGGERYGDIYIPPPTKPHCSSDGKGKPRLIITKIVLRNFKSYAGEIELGPFGNCFNAIIGPNGSGKSNVIDSMLFVFGYRANKIRCKKLSVLLHSSTKHPHVNNCYVAIHFRQIIDLPNGLYDLVKNSDFSISRTAHKDNSSFYKINDERVQFKDVAKLLKSHYVDLDHNRFLILQGEVESIAMMKSKAQNENECGLLEYLEDIIGTSRYKEPLIKINTRVEALTEERTEKHNRVKLSERELDDLSTPMSKAVEYLNLENDYTRAKNLQFQKYMSDNKKKLSGLKEEQESIKTNLDEHDKKYATIKEQRIEKENIIKQEIAHYEQLIKNKEEHEQKLKNALNKFNEVQAFMEATNAQRKQTKNLLTKEMDNLEKLKKVPNSNLTEIGDCEQKIEKLTKQKTELENKLQENLLTFQSEIQPFIDQKETLQTQMGDLQSTVNECKSSVQLSESELKIFQHSEIAETRRYETFKNAYLDSKKELLEKQEIISKFNIAELQASVRQFEKELQENKQQESILYEKIRKERADIAEKMTALQTRKSNNKVLDSLMQQKRDGNIPGIFGRLGDLGGIDAKYDVAISTCCGRLDNIVVDTVNTAQSCIEYLKRSDVGRATFIALEKVAHFANVAEQHINTPENAPRLYDLIYVEDERILPAFYFSLRDTLVANDLDQGTRIAYGARRFRVVTLKGEVIETSGTMAGGGTTQMRGRMGQSVQTKTTQQHNSSIIFADLERQKADTENMQCQVNYLQELQGKLERDIATLKQKIRADESSKIRIENQYKILLEQLPRLENQMLEQEKTMNLTKADPERVAQLKRDVEIKGEALEKAVKATKKFTDKIDEINGKIDSIRGDKVKSIEKKIDDLTKQITKLSKNISKLKVEITTSERNVKKSEDKITNFQQDIKNAEELLLKSNGDRQTAEEDSAKFTDIIKKSKEDIENAQHGSSGMKKEIVSLQKQENDGKLKRIEIEQELTGIDKQIKTVTDQIPHWQRELATLQYQEIPFDDKPKESLKVYTEDELNTYKTADLVYKCSVIEDKLKMDKPNLSVINEYYKKRDVYLERVKILEAITNKRNEMRFVYDDVRKKRYNEFMQGFSIITKKLKEMYQMITQGGDAELELVDSMDPFSEGVTFSVRPAKKSWKNISNLSGGEKTLSSLALVFALHYYKPSPLYFMDEIDAALDFRNVSIVANYIKARTKNAQFIIISLRSNMFELADYLTGIYKVFDCTESLTIENVVPAFSIHTSQISQNQTNFTTTSQTLTDSQFDSLRESQDTIRQTQSSNYPLNLMNAENITEDIQMLDNSENTDNITLNSVENNDHQNEQSSSVSDNQAIHINNVEVNIIPPGGDRLSSVDSPLISTN